MIEKYNTNSCKTLNRSIQFWRTATAANPIRTSDKINNSIPGDRFVQCERNTEHAGKPYFDRKMCLDVINVVQEYFEEIDQTEFKKKKNIKMMKINDQLKRLCTEMRLNQPFNWIFGFEEGMYPRLTGGNKIQWLDVNSIVFLIWPVAP